MNSIDLEKLKQSFKLVDGVLFKKNKSTKGEWIPAITKEYARYHSVFCEGVSYQTHTVVWALANNQVPTYAIDHIDGNINNNHPSNLREATPRDNSVNRKIHRAGKQAGYSYLPDRNKYRTYISFKGDQIALGDFDTAEKAVEMYELARSLEDHYDGDLTKFRDFVRSKSNFDFSGPNGCSKRTGKSPSRNKWESSIYIVSKNVYLGAFDSKEIANAVYAKANELKHLYENNKQFRELVLSSISTDLLPSKRKGYSFVKARSKWKVEIQQDGKKMLLGYFDSESEAKGISDRADKLRNQFLDKEQFKKLVLSTKE